MIRAFQEHKKSVILMVVLTCLLVGSSPASSIEKQCDSVEPVAHYFVHISDTHVTAPGDDYWLEFQQDVLSWNNPPLFVMVTGDLVEYGAGDLGADNFEAFLSILYGEPGQWYLDAAGHIPMLFCPGNHDSRYWHQIPSIHSLVNYQLFIDPDLFTADNMRIVSNCAILSLHSGYDTFLDLDHIWLPEGDGLTTFFIELIDQEFDGLDGQVNMRDDSEYTKIILMHHPYVNPNGQDGNMMDGVFLNYRSEFRQLCEQYEVDLVLTGHTHATGDDLMQWNLDGEPWDPADGTRCIDGGSLRDHYTITNISINLGKHHTVVPLNHG